MAMMIQKIRLAGALALVFLSPRMAVADGALAIGAASPIVQGGLVRALRSPAVERMPSAAWPRSWTPLA